jgi:predicted metal-binding protein
MLDKKVLEPLFDKHGFPDFTWIDPREAIVAHWVRMKCKHGCDGYGTHPMCPPEVPPIEECRQFFAEYATGVIFHMTKQLDDPAKRHAWTSEINARLLALERDVFLAGNVKAFALYPGGCRVCADCPDTRDDCHKPESARPTPESLGMDVFSTVRHYGLPIDVLTDYDNVMNRYAFLLVE